MALTHEMIEERIRLFQDMMESAYDMPYWVYDTNGTILESNRKDQMVLESFIKASGCGRYIKEYGRISRQPVILSAPLGMMWLAGFEFKGDELYRVYLFGPVFHTEVSVSVLQKKALENNLPLTWRSTFNSLMATLPVISNMVLTRLAVMLHRALTDETITVSDVRYQQMKPSKSSSLSLWTEEDDEVVRDRYQTYMAEQALLGSVREGNMNFSAALDRAQALSRGLPVDSKDPQQQALVSIIVFISLCTRAAIEGGLTPEKAYSTGDSFIQLAYACENISELTSVGSDMYREFIMLVHDQKARTDLSPAIQSCCDYIQMHPETDLSIEVLAKRCGYTEYYLSRKFKKETGLVISDYVNRQRIERAKTLLVTTTDSLQDISDRLHFGTRSYFAQTFKKVTGMSPSEYRKANQRL